MYNPELFELCNFFAMDPSAANEVEKPDIDFLRESANMPVDFSQIPDGCNVSAMRQWIDDVLLHGPLAESRAKLQLGRRNPPVDVKRHDVQVSCSDGKSDIFSIRVYDSQSEVEESCLEPRPAVVMLHGGGWIHGEPRCDEAVAMLFASELRAVVFGVDYRLAPEHPFPAALNDCNEALHWIFRNAIFYNIDTNRLALWGASAGGNLAAAVALQFSQSPPLQNLSLRLVSLVVPVTAHPDAHAHFESKREIPWSKAEGAFSHRRLSASADETAIRKLYEFYTTDPSDVFNPLASPLLAVPTSLHPKTHITVAACDYLHAQGLAYAQLLRSAGVDVMEDVLSGVPHGFTLVQNAEVTRGWLKRQMDTLRAALEI